MEPQHHPQFQGAPTKEGLNWVNWGTLSPLFQGFRMRWNCYKPQNPLTDVDVANSIPSQPVGKDEGKRRDQTQLSLGLGVEEEDKGWDLLLQLYLIPRTPLGPPGLCAALH